MQLSAFPTLAAVAVALLGCSSPSASSSSPATTEPEDSGVADVAPEAAEETAPTSACAAPPKKSGCDNESSWIRGVAHFDASHFMAGTKPVLRVALRHGFALYKGEETIGGRLHEWKSFPIADATKGEVAFAIDMCGEGTAMWSEENGAFNLALIVDEDGNNDIDDATTNDEAIQKGIPGATELAKLVKVDVSCHAPTACLDVALDCTGGVACTTVEPLTSCTKKTPGCESDSAFCK
ncbi:MAG: hypothetical protein ACXVEE_11365 [Polyangiales bacterium]